MKRITTLMLLTVACACLWISTLDAQPPIVPSLQELNAPFGTQDRANFLSPPAVYNPETYLLFIGENISKEGITADLEAIAEAGISGVLFFHGQFGGLWPKVDKPVVSLSPQWDDAVKHIGDECRRLGLRFTMLGCPGWALAGGPWIKKENAMRNLSYSSIEVEGGAQNLSLPLPPEAADPNRDWQDIMTLAFPTPEGSRQPLRPSLASSGSGNDIAWLDYFIDKPKTPAILPPALPHKPHLIELMFDEPTVVRTIELPSINWMNPAWCYEPGVKIRALAIRPDGGSTEILNTELQQSNWMDMTPLSLACNEAGAASTYHIIIDNQHQTSLNYLRLYSAAMKHSYESEAGWTLRSIDRRRGEPSQSPKAYIDYSKLIDLTASTDTTGKLVGALPAGKWTILRIGHVNAGMRNGPAPPEATGWECNKLSTEGADANFAGYIGRLSRASGPLAGGLLNSIEIDSWECYTQTWTADMEKEFRQITGYELRRWLPAVFGYVMNDSETTTRFLRDWRAVVGNLFAERFYGRMARLAHQAGLGIQYETAAGDIFPADIMEYYKYADMPMCEFWQPFADNYVGSINFKPIKPTASAARMYGKPRVAAEALTSFHLTWDEHPEMLKGVANVNMIDGVTHCIFHTYTHNPQVGFLPPGTSFGSSIGTPFLRGQTWWRHMPEFTTYLARCSYMLERGRPVSDVLWYLGDEIDHKPDQNAPFPTGYKYDYCNPDVLLNRLAVRNGQLTTPEGIAYRLLWLPQNERMLPETLEKILALAKAGATIVGNAPRCLATLSGGKKAQQRFNKAVKALWGNAAAQPVRTIGKGKVISGTSIDEALTRLNIQPDVKVVSGSAPLWSHRQVDGADWYFVCAPHGTGSEGIKTRLSFRNNGEVEVWNPVTGNKEQVGNLLISKDRVDIDLELPPSGSCFVVFKHGDSPALDNVKQQRASTDNTRYSPLNKWTLSFPDGWGAPASIVLDTLKAWKDLDISAEGRAFSGTAVYTTSFDVGDKPKNIYMLDLGKVEMIASVWLNGKHVRTVWAQPYIIDIENLVQAGVNTLRIEVTSSWFNRLVYDASLPEAERKTWTISAPSKDAPLRESGLLGPVRISD